MFLGVSMSGGGTGNPSILGKYPKRNGQTWMRLLKAVMRLVDNSAFTARPGAALSALNPRPNSL